MIAGTKFLGHEEMLCFVSQLVPEYCCFLQTWCRLNVHLINQNHVREGINLVGRHQIFLSLIIRYLDMICSSAKLLALCSRLRFSKGVSSSALSLGSACICEMLKKLSFAALCSFPPCQSPALLAIRTDRSLTSELENTARVLQGSLLISNADFFEQIDSLTQISYCTHISLSHFLSLFESIP